MREKISIPKSISTPRGPSKGPQNKGGINGAIKPTEKIAKSAQSGDATETDADSKNNSDDGEVAKDDGSEQKWEAGKPISKDAEKAAADTTKALWSGYWDYKRSELDHQRGMQQDQLDFQKQQLAMQQANQNSGIGAGIAAQGIGALTSALGGLGGGRGASGGGGSSGSGGATGHKPEEHMLAENEEKKAFEDQDQIIQVDAKGNPIDPKDAQAMGQANGQIAQSTNQSTFQARPAAHEDMLAHNATVESYGDANGMSISSHGTEMQAHSRGEGIDFTLAEAEPEEVIEIPEPEIEIAEEELA
jgi:hypothetical protein